MERVRPAAQRPVHRLRLLLPGALVLILALYGLGLPAALGIHKPGDGLSLFALLIAALGLVIARRQPGNSVAILKYYLYDIDRLISRTVSYTLVTGLLIGVYAGVVTFATHVLPFTSPVGVAASTLAVAALFNPLRRRVQRMVDRRFNRARYDAERTVTAFASRLKDAVDLDSIRDDLTGSVHRALEPAHISVWLSPQAGRPANDE
jgi:hypothetical protein